MAGSFNGTVVGKVAKDPEARANGKAQGFSVPVSKGKDQPTTWVRVTAWGKTAEYVAQYVKKGSLVSCSGSIETREFDGKNGKQTSLELNAASVTQFRTDSSPDITSAPKPTVMDDDIPF